MDFTIDDDQWALQELTREILGDHTGHERLKELEREPGAVFDRELWNRLAGAGVTGCAVPEDYGGSGLGVLELALVCEEAGRVVAPVPMVATLALGALPLSRYGSPARCERSLPGVVSGSTLLTAALAEPGETDPVAPTTVAHPDGDGWRITGEKAFVPYGGQADAVLVPAATGPGAVGVFVVDRDAPGVGVTELLTTDRQPTAHLTFDGVAAGADDVLGDPHGGEEVVRFAAAHAMVALACVQAGVCAGALRMTASYTSGREQFGKPIAALQAVGQRAADAYVDSELVRLTAYEAAWRLDRGWPAADEVSVAKFWAADGGQRVVHACQHLHGGIGVDRDYPLHRYFLATKQIEHTLGTATRQLLTLGASLAVTGT